METARSGHESDVLELYQSDTFALLLPTGDRWNEAHLRRTYSSRNIVRTANDITISAVQYPRMKAGGTYKDAAMFLSATERLPTDISVERRMVGTYPMHRTQYTNRTIDRYYALLEDPSSLLEIDLTGPCGFDPPPLDTIVASVVILPLPTFVPPTLERLTLPKLALDVPREWDRRDEYNRPLNMPHVAPATGVSLSLASPIYRTRQMSPPQYRLQELEPGKRLDMYLVGLKTDRRRSSIDGAMYQFLGEQRLRHRHCRGTRLTYSGYSPSGIRGPMEWYHELLLLEVGDVTLLVTAYCDWIERERYQPIFARMTASLARC